MSQRYSGSLMSKTPLVVIVGPTASGKSELAIRVAEAHNGEIICADSRTVYKGMDIGTAKPTPEDQARVPHHLLDIVEPGQPFNAAMFKELADRAIEDITAQGKLPILVGGTGLYIDAVIFDYEFGEPADPARREALQRQTVEELQEICRQKHIELPVNSRNKRHLIRAIELQGLPQRKAELRPHTLVVGISTDKEVLRSRIAERAYAMITQGIEGEVRQLGEKYGWQGEAMTGNIYRIFKQVIDGIKSQDEAIQECIKSDALLAKRQLTWFRRNPYTVWGTPQELLQKITHFLDVVKR